MAKKRASRTRNDSYVPPSDEELSKDIPSDTGEEEGPEEDLTAPMKFSIKKEDTEVSVLIEGDDGDVLYHLKKLTGKDRELFLNAFARRTTTDKTGEVTGYKNYRGMFADLLTKCFGRYEVTSDGEGFTYITSEEIDELPAPVVEAIFRRAMKFSSLDDEAKERAKND